VESYLKYNGNAFTRRFDANSYLYVTKAMDYFDLSQPTGSLVASFANAAHVKFLVVSFTSDWLYPSYHSKRLVSSLMAVGADVTYLDIQSTWGHDAFLLEVETMTELLTAFLDRLVSEEGIADGRQEIAVRPARLIQHHEVATPKIAVLQASDEERRAKTEALA
jgi:homoserine O-acetyltransferase